MRAGSKHYKFEIIANKRDRFAGRVTSLAKPARRQVPEVGGIISLS